MGQKVNPIGLRLQITRTWDSRWFAEKDYSDLILEDYKVRKFIKNRVYHAGISKIEIERAAQRLRIRIFTARPGIIIGKKGVEIESLK
ncbi:MAG: KH domain-containing protein, partial [Deltaproteobacteria bacterium]|nr:KH domain-containing protein [Deltaproteobacteria bacterium]